MIKSATLSINKHLLTLFFAYMLFGCGGGSDGGSNNPAPSGKNIQIQGTLPIGVSTPKASMKPGDNLRSNRVSLTSTLKVAVLPAQKEILEDEDATISSPDSSGEFSIELEPLETEYVILVYDDSLGEGVDQLIGYIELTVDESESSASWQLSQIDDEALLNLGDLQQNEIGTLQPLAEGLDSIYETLNIEASDLILKASRDNYLKVVQNYYFNRHLGIDLDFGYSFALYESINTIVNQWMTPEDVVIGWNKEYRILIDPIGNSLAEVDRLVLGLFNGDPAVTLTPPAEIRLDDGRTWSPDNPLTNADFGDALLSPEENAGGGFGTSPLGLPPEGTWYLSVGDNEGAYDFNLTSPIDSEGNFIYFTPILRINTDPDTGVIANFQVRWAYWDTYTESYSIISENSASAVPPLVSDFQIGVAGILNGSGEEFFPPFERQEDGSYSVDGNITTDGSNESNSLMAVDISYRIGEVRIFFTFWM
jgi:hypothetical protein